MLEMNSLLSEHFCVAVDSRMGTGKTTVLMDYMKNDEEHRFIFVTPLRKEIERVIKDTDGKFKQPYNPFGSKLDSLHELLRTKENIAMSHSLFALTTPETIELIAAGDYVMVVDEALTLTQPYNSFAPSHHLPEVKPGDIDKILLKKQFIAIDPDHGSGYGQIEWLGGDVDDSHYEPIANLVKTGALYCAGADGSGGGESLEGVDISKSSSKVKSFIWEFPPAIFAAVKNVIALSYLMKGSLFDSYLKHHKMTPYYVSAKMIGERESSLVPYVDTNESKWDLVELIDVITGPLNEIGEGRTALSMNYYKNANDESLKTICDNMRKVVENYGYSTSDILWTAPKDATIWNLDRRDKYNSSKKSKTASTVKRPIQCKHHDYVEHPSVYQKKIAESRREYDELKSGWRKLESMHIDHPLTGELLEQLKYCRQVCENGPLTEEDFSTFLSCNTKATNQYSDRHLCLYMVNRFLQPQIADFYKKRGQPIDEDVFALSEMIQWIWRSAIRKGEPITVYIPSRRMRELFLDWLGVNEQYYIDKHKRG